MKSEPKAFASLSSGLLARKGGAKPAMRPQGFGQGAASLEDLGWNDMGFEPPRVVTPLRDEDHDAFGDEVAEPPLRNPVAGLTPVPSPVHSQHAELADRFAPSNEDEAEADDTVELDEPVAQYEAAPLVVAAPVNAAPRREPSPRAAPGSKAKAAFTLRLDPERHLKLRLACAVGGRSAQLIVTDALDALLAAMPELNAMAAKASRKG
ncbi:MAG: hypothetical protein ABIW16_06900 [Sphingomicrobium sp.]